ncbi:sn-glycerol-3-phosphate ABC transporter ATP-binding protein UgpC [Terrilactibacillus sp. BCM23-1]|uniref:sn-glycerol-3-phosphate ABC transporter ATP-binding protein UgpC n=1 Tax=Terrilactibacillus tamarindi TaxID=2599694 RepID=A0A6N8CQ94_9BACI|nr:sn-glycerol-3-phosphate ABC transporter ATP-binding protein UgpC [Terrilactibacillus tamarindi]MTT32369.1 sn-glycerol-3-phosphate ABC transporter ATP-binding protein UgpC [Terrilactibacillus tamarindi]
MAKIVMKNIKKRYKNSDSLTVKDFNLSIDHKEFIVLVGPSGCGKSTTLRMIAGLEDISEGDLLIEEKRMNDVAPKNRDIAMVFQNYALYPHMTVYDNMAFALKIKKMNKSEIDLRVKEAAKILGLEEYLKRKPKALSGGQRQRVALGRAMVRNPKVFLMDEPLSNLDAKLRSHMRAEISKLHRKLGATTIYVTHDQTEAMTMASRIVIMKDGIIQQIGTPKEVYDRPVNRFVAGFIGSPSMNFISATCSDTALKIGDFTFTIPEEKIEILKSQGYLNKKITLGIRPEDIHHEPKKEKNNSNTFQATIDVSELMGSESLLYTSLGDSTLIAKVKSTNIANGEKVTLSIDFNKIHFFDKDTEEVIQSTNQSRLIAIS